MNLTLLKFKPFLMQIKWKNYLKRLQESLWFR